jgi:hypothetical protein
VVAAALAVHPQARRRVRAAHHGALDRGDQQATPGHALGAQPGGRAPEQVEQGTQRCGADPAAGLGERTRGRGGHRQPAQPRGHLRPHLPVPQLGEQSRGQQQVDHHPPGQVPHPRLDRAGLAQHGVDHLEGHDLGQLTEMTRREPASSDSDHTGDDRIDGQRSSREEDVCQDMNLSPELRCLDRDRHAQRPAQSPDGG